MKRSLVINLCFISVGLMMPGVLFANDANISRYSQQPKFSTKKLPPYDLCKKEALERWRKAPKSTEREQGLRDDIDRCKEVHAASFAYKLCKRQVLVDLKSKRKISINEAKSRVARCREDLKTRSFPGDEPIPVWTDEGKQLFFAGVGINDSIPIDRLAIKGFDCAKVKTSLAVPAQRDFLVFPFLFNPEWFPRWYQAVRGAYEGKELEELAKDVLAKSKLSQKEFERDEHQLYSLIAEKFGAQPQQNTKDNKAKNPMYTIRAYPATVPCIYDYSVMPLFSSASIHYLLDLKGAQAVPFFGLVFYNSDANSQAKVGDPFVLADRLAKQLGSNFKVFKNKNTDLIAVSESDSIEFDHNGDPTSLCTSRFEPVSSVIGVIKIDINAGKPAARYLLVSSVNNLCEYQKVVGRITTRAK